MINVYDWFESFQAVVEVQREELAKAALAAAATADGKGGGKAKEKAKGKDKGTDKDKGKAKRDASPTKKGKARQVNFDDSATAEAVPSATHQATKPGEEDEEKWRLEVQARFMRALHELDYLGFVKHTKRRADHVVRTVFDVNE